MRSAAVFLLFLAPAMLSAGKVKEAVPARTAETAVFCIFGAQSGKPFGSEASFKSVVWKSDVIYTGNSCGQMKTPSAPLEILKALRIARGTKIAVGFEELDISQQILLDDYSSGKISEDEFLSKTGWDKNRDCVGARHKPLLDFIISNKLRALALNIPERIAENIARTGLAGLGEEDKKLVPAAINVSKNKKYLEFLKNSFTPGADADKPASLDNYLTSVAAGNETMGLRIADFINTNPGWSVLIIAGNGRIIYNAAIPASVKSRTNKINQASFYLENAPCPAAFPKSDKDKANYVWYISDSTSPASTTKR